ncbi:MAG: 50S ribosomal protein L11 methyltransferase [Deltaproteobacteria bacterium]|nr:50S ribosomal protein L11 methyltransferase [Deltaproteobacteria bacterium]
MAELLQFFLNKERPKNKLNTLNIDHITTHSSYKDLYIYYLEGSLKREEESHLGLTFLGNWAEEDSSFLFFTQPSKDLVQRIIDKDKELRLIDEFHFTYEEWLGGKVIPRKVSRFLIVPPWEDRQQNDGELKMLLNPGVVFGTSLHPTTRDSLLALLEISDRLLSYRVLDLGTGTGILAIGAALLGAEKVLAVDNNPLAVKTAALNVKLNGLEQSIEVREGLAEDIGESPSDLLIANIHYDIILKLIKDGGFIKKKYFILSGLMRSQARNIRLELSHYPIEIVHEWDNDMIWRTILGKVKEFQNG